MKGEELYDRYGKDILGEWEDQPTDVQRAWEEIAVGVSADLAKAAEELLGKPPFEPGADLVAGIQEEDLMTTAEVAKVFRVDNKTVNRWAGAGLVPSIRTLGGHRRYRRSDIEAILATGPDDG